MCKPCEEGRHRECESSDCDCPRRQEDEAVERSLAAIRQGDEGLAETIFSNLIYGGSQVARMMTEGVGKDAVKVFIQQVLRAHAAMKC